MHPQHTLLGSLANLRALPEMAADPLAYFARIAKEQGGVAAFAFGPRAQWLLTEPEAIRTAYIANHDALAKDRATLSMAPLFQNGIITSSGDTWKRKRTLVSPSFRPAHIQAYADQAVTYAERQPMVEGPTQAHATMLDVMQKVMLAALFGEVDEAGTEIADTLTAYINCTERELFTLWRFWPQAWPTPARRMAVTAYKTITAHLAPKIAQRRAHPGGIDILARLMEATDKQGQKLNDHELFEEAATVFFAGFETSAATLAFAAKLLSEAPEVQAQLQAEREEVLGDRRPTAGDVRALVRHAAVLDETMRLYPSVWGLGRQVLKPFQIGEHHIKVGHQVVASPWVVHRDARWFDQPEAFRPERFLDEETKKRPAMTYIPFGVGPRTCVGQHLAKMEMVLALATWLKDRTLHPMPDRPLTTWTGIALKPASGAWVDVKART